MNDDRGLIRNNLCFIDGYAYVASHEYSKGKSEKFDYEQKKWIALPNYPIKHDSSTWSSALSFTPQEIKQETIKAQRE